MTRAPRMNVNGRAQLGETPGRPGMIEMNVTEKNMPNVVRRETRGAHRDRDIFEGCRRPGIENAMPSSSRVRSRR